MGYKIITDSTIDMDHKMIEELGLTVVPLRFTIDGKTYKDKADLSDMPTETFYAKLREGKMSTKMCIRDSSVTVVSAHTAPLSSAASTVMPSFVTVSL